MLEDKRGTWFSGLGSLFLAAIVALGVRWLLIEAYVIPSGSMLPTLLIQDHIFVNKVVYGVRFPWTKKWLAKFRAPERGEVIIFRYPENEDTFFIKRVVATSGDRVTWDGERLTVNGQLFQSSPHPKPNQILSIIKENELPGGKENYEVREETFTKKSHPVLINKHAIHAKVTDLKVPPESLFVMGDNRDNSSDSRYWGFVPLENVVGRAMFVWLSCNETFSKVTFLCNPTTIRWKRFFHVIE